MLALAALLAAPCMQLCAEECLELKSEKQKVKLGKSQRKKISQQVLGDLKKQKALDHLDSRLTLLALASGMAAGICNIHNVNVRIKDESEWTEDENSKKQKPLAIAIKPLIAISAVAALAKIPVSLKRMGKEGYYVGWNPFKLAWHGIKFHTVDMWA